MERIILDLDKAELKLLMQAIDRGYFKPGRGKGQYWIDIYNMYDKLNEAYEELTERGNRNDSTRT